MAKSVDLRVFKEFHTKSFLYNLRMDKGPKTSHILRNIETTGRNEEFIENERYIKISGHRDL